MKKNQLTEDMANRIIEFYGENGYMTESGIKNFIKDSNFSISRYYEVCEKDVEIFLESFD